MTGAAVPGAPPAPPGAAAGVIVALLLCLVLSRVVALRVFPLFDDAFITFRYAKNLVAGHGFVYNPGEWVLGTTAPLWGMVSAMVLAAGGAPPVAIPLANVALDLVIVAIAWRLMFCGDPVGLGVFIAGLALSPVVARVTAGGMESHLFLVFTLTAFLLHARGLVYAAVMLAAVSYFLRPEGVLTVGILCLAELVLARRLVRTVGMGLLAAATLGPGLAIVRALYGSVLPQSVATKAQYPRHPAGEVLVDLLAREPVSAAIAVVGGVGLVMALRRGGAARLLALWYVGYLAAYLVKGPKIWTWYGFPLVCLGAMFAGQVASRAVAAWRPAWPRVLGRAAAMAAAALVAVFWIAVGVGRGPDRITQNVYRPVEAFCRGVRPADTIAAGDIGVIGYYCPAAILDMEGLVWPAWKDYKNLPDLAARRAPTYLFLVMTPRTLPAMQREPLASSYVLVRRFAADGEPDALTVANKPRGDWTQEYVLYRRAAP